LTEVSDLCAVIEYAKGLDYTDSSNILLMGCSQGGFVSALTAAKLKNEIENLVLFYPAFCIPDDARRGKMMWAKFDPNNIPETVKCGPMKLSHCYVADVVNMNPFDEIKGYEGDVLIVHGTAAGGKHFGKKRKNSTEENDRE
jgi:alpha-beta hydrolase superfamily lysophospholipase